MKRYLKVSSPSLHYNSSSLLPTTSCFSSSSLDEKTENRAKKVKKNVDVSRLCCWNANGILTRMKHHNEFQQFANFAKENSLDVICIQEVKLPAECALGCKKGDGKPRKRGELKKVDKKSSEESAMVEENIKNLFSDFDCIWSLSDWKYAGQLMLLKKGIQTRNIRYNLNMNEDSTLHHKDGRVIIVEFDKFVLLSTYSPNNGWNFQQFERRRNWDAEIENYVKHMKDSKKKLVWIGDMNCAPEDSDLSHPKFFRSILPESSVIDGKTIAIPKEYIGQPGCTDAERERYHKALNEGDLIDAFRYCNPAAVSPPINSANYSWRGNSGISYAEYGRYYNRAMRIDHLLVNRNLLQYVTEARIVGYSAEKKNFFGSDHCPLILEINIST